jgi:hypothetical protein
MDDVHMSRMDFVQMQAMDHVHGFPLFPAKSLSAPAAIHMVTTSHD